jgi:hypothetical protein
MHDVEYKEDLKCDEFNVVMEHVESVERALRGISPCAVCCQAQAAQAQSKQLKHRASTEHETGGEGRHRPSQRTKSSSSLSRSLFPPSPPPLICFDAHSLGAEERRYKKTSHTPQLMTICSHPC